jgi:hypothetical protein
MYYVYILLKNVEKSGHTLPLFISAPGCVQKISDLRQKIKLIINFVQKDGA